MLWSDKVYRITGKTNKTPKKYRVSGKWILKNMLLKSAPVDKESEKIIESRSKKSEGVKKSAKHARIREIEKRNEEFARSTRRPRRAAAIRGRARKLASEKNLALDKLIGPE